MRRKNGLITKIEPLIDVLCIFSQETVANTAHVLNGTGYFYSFQFSSYPAKAGVQTVFRWNVIVAPNLLIELFLCKYPARIGRQQIEQIELTARELYFLCIDKHFAKVHADQRCCPVKEWYAIHRSAGSVPYRAG